MKILHICCNLAGSTVFPQLFEALKREGIEQTVFVPEKSAANLGKNRPEGVKTHAALTVHRSDALLFFRKAQRSVPEIERSIDLGGVTLIHAHTLFTDGSIALSAPRRRSTSRSSPTVSTAPSPRIASSPGSTGTSSTQKPSLCRATMCSPSRSIQKNAERMCTRRCGMHTSQLCAEPSVPS